MIKFVVVEDDEKTRNAIKEIIRSINIKYEQNIETSYYGKYCDKLESEINSLVYRKVYIMDIELENSISGIDIAEKIRENDWDSEIIFVTCHDKMFETAYRTVLDVFDFIEKFQDMEKRLTKDIELIMNKKYDKKQLKINTKYIDLEIYLKEILYIVTEDRKLIIHTKEVEFKVAMTLESMKELLDERFIQTHKSCIANKDHMIERNYAKGYFVLDTGEHVDLLSKKYRKVIEGK